MYRINRRAPRIQALVQYLDRGDGICRHFNTETDTCEIFDTRPDICRASKWPATHEYLAEWCERLEKEAYGEEAWEEQYGKTEDQ
jgi:Fe-S-cluster containining protein